MQMFNDGTGSSCSSSLLRDLESIECIILVAGVARYDTVLLVCWALCCCFFLFSLAAIFARRLFSVSI